VTVLAAGKFQLSNKERSSTGKKNKSQPGEKRETRSTSRKVYYGLGAAKLLRVTARENRGELIEKNKARSLKAMATLNELSFGYGYFDVGNGGPRKRKKSQWVHAIKAGDGFRSLSGGQGRRKGVRKRSGWIGCQGNARLHGPGVRPAVFIKKKCSIQKGRAEERPVMRRSWFRGPRVNRAKDHRVCKILSLQSSAAARGVMK